MSPSVPAASVADENLSGPERQVLTAAISGTLVDLRIGNASDDDPAQGKRWDTSRQIRASLLAELLIGKQLADGNQPRAIRLRGARIIGPLDLEASTIVCLLLLQDCHFDEPVNLEEAAAPAVRMPGSHLMTLTARRLRTIGDLILTGTHFATGEICLTGAHIGGQLNLDGASLSNPDGTALAADGLIVDQGMFCRSGFTTTGEIRLIGAYIGGNLVLSGATLANPSGRALTADGLTVGQGMFCRDHFTATGEIRLQGAHIGGQFSITGNLENHHGPALTADNLTVGLDMNCRDDFTAFGELRLLGAHIGGTLNLSGATLANPSGPVLSADRLTVERSMFCRGLLTATGELRLLGAHIGGQLDLGGARLINASGRALYADGLSADTGMFCRGLNAAGEVRLVGAHIGGQLSLIGASLQNHHGPALTADRITVDLDMNCRDEFTATGEIRLPDAHIGRLDVSATSLANPNGAVLNLKAANVSALILLPHQQPDGAVNLTNAKVGTYLDNPASWPAVLHLRGFTYDSLENNDVGPRGRLRWLARDPGGYTPQLYDQLAAALRRAGDEQAARKIAIAKQHRRRHPYNPLNWLWYVTVGYGYRTWLAGAWLAAFLAIGTWVFSRTHVIATEGHPPPFHPFAYAVDVVLPIMDLGQKNAWEPEGAALYWSWVLTGAGWILTTAAVAGLTGVLKRD